MTMNYMDSKDGTNYGHRSYASGQRLSYGSRRTREELLRRRIERAEAELVELEEQRAKYGEDLEDGDVITFSKTFTNGANAKRYSYAAIRVDGMWFTTGPKSPKSYTWAELIEWFGGDGSVFDLKVVTKRQRYPRR